MSAVINSLHKAFDVFFIPFGNMDPFWGMLTISAVTGVLMLFVYKYTSNQKAIAQVKDLIKAHLMEAWIYREDVAMMLRAQALVLRANTRYIYLNLKPLMVMIVPVLIILVHLNFRYGMKPLAPGDEVIIKSVRQTAVAADEMDEKLIVPEGVTVQTEGVRIEERGEVSWRVKAMKEGSFPIKITAGDKDYEMTLSAVDFGKRITSRRGSSFSDAFFYPGEPAMPSDGALKKIEIGYSTLSPAIPGTKWRPHWLIQYFILSLVFGLALKGPLKVEI